MSNLKLTKEEVIHVAKLAGLTLTPQEVKKFQKQLSEVLDYVEILKKLKTTEVEPTSQVTGLENVFREDKVGSGLSQEETLSGAKNQEKGMFKIKAIFE
ncbi:MAG: Asp-tRNA(Asn)/Glu-tRNA(Gln) amidotransferase subunit GatC [Patescibacteria group bacterium]